MSKSLPSLIKFITSAGIISSAAFSGIANADAPGGDGCGWGYAMFEGGTTKFDHAGAAFMNGFSLNQSLGIMSNTNGCKAEGTIGQYQGKAWGMLHSSIDSLAEDIALGDGEVLNALTMSLGIKDSEKAEFKSLLHTNFSRIFPSENIQSEQVVISIKEILVESEKFAAYAS